MPDAAWREPAALLPLRFGGYRTRYLIALGLIIAGGLMVQATSVYANYLLGLGITAQLTGWLILPGRGLRRLAVALPATLGASAALIGSAGAILLVLPLASWLYLRQRPLIAYLVLAFPVISGVILAQLFPQYGNGLTVVSVSLVVLVVSAWLAQAVARGRPRPADAGKIPSNSRDFTN